MSTLSPAIDKDKDVISCNSQHDENNQDVKEAKICYSKQPTHYTGRKGKTKYNDSNSYTSQKE